MSQLRTYPVDTCRLPARHTHNGAKRLLRTLCLLLACLPATAAAEVMPETEYRVKTAFLYNFARFVTWPALPQDEFRLCVLGSTPLAAQMSTLLNKTVHQRPLMIRHLDSAAGIDACQMLYIGKSWQNRLREVLPALGTQPVLTVSEIDDFAEAGGMIGFLVIDNKVRFEINTDAAEQAGLTISSKLLTLATSIRARDR